MEILLTGATGYIGNAVLARLLASEHQVRAVVRNEEKADAVRVVGVTPVVGDLFDPAWLRGQLDTVDGAIHTAAGSDERDAALNDAVIEAVLASFAGTEKPFVHTGGVWTYGDNPDIADDDPQQPPAITAWRPAGEQRLLTSGVRASVVRPGIVYGHGGGIPAMLAAGPRDEAGALVLIGTGDQHWPTVHVDELADLYVLVLHQAPGGTAYVGANGTNPTVRELGEAAVGPDATVVAGSAEEAAGRFGAAFAEALLLDQQSAGRAARALGWEPSAPSLVELLRDGYPGGR
ncbi:NAD-dependent epimerase/dehydratase family protein [Nocardioides rubriscoriae]|uniref:NAD-dependent epimerase/dehydratase family protein n=1 Tax=Nocardioides rubriscoriae TaxID=642762 RepID=UPI0011DF416E|nr:NAD-dependent epimerase/dehydratase family protein [Nocardioides rubriscoriae]